MLTLKLKMRKKNNKLKKYKRAKLDSDDDKKQAKNHKVRINNNNEIIEDREKYNEEDHGDNKKIFIYTLIIKKENIFIPITRSRKTKITIN